MKPVKIFVACCTGLLTLAAVIGIIDYAKATKTGKLKTLYKGEQSTVAASIFNKEIEVEDYSRGPLKAEPSITKTDNLNNEVRNPEYRKEYSSKQGIIKKAANKTKTIVKKKQEKEVKELDLKSFSRAPLRKFKKEIIAESVIDSINAQAVVTKE